MSRAFKVISLIRTLAQIMGDAEAREYALVRKPTQVWITFVNLLRACSPTAEYVPCTDEIRVQFPTGPLFFEEK